MHLAGATCGLSDEQFLKLNDRTNHIQKDNEQIGPRLQAWNW